MIEECSPAQLKYRLKHLRLQTWFRSKKEGALRSGQQWEGLTVSLMWKFSRACTLGNSNTVCYRDSPWKKEMFKRNSLKEFKVLLMISVINQSLLGSIYFTAVTVTLPVPQDKEVCNCLFETVKRLWWCHIVCINWQGGWILFTAMLFLPLN